MKPFVVIVPEKDRGLLRSNGVIPPYLFHDLEDYASFKSEFDSKEARQDARIYLWPYDVDYSNSGDLARDMKTKPADVPAFLGLRPKEGIRTPEEAIADKINRERILFPLLGAVVIHVVFLDDVASDGGYAHFNSFKDLATWGRNFERALKKRFPDGEYSLKETEFVLVVIARGEQLQSTPGDLKDFYSILGEDKVFKSCYFMNFNMQIGRGNIYHSKCVWDLMLSRLLVVFLLDQAKQHDIGQQAERTQTIWRQHSDEKIPHVKVWGCGDCTLQIEAEGANFPFVNEILKEVKKDILQEEGKNFDAGKMILGLAPENEKSLQIAGNPKELELTKRSFWSDFPVDTCVAGATQGEKGDRWSDYFSNIREEIKKRSKSRCLSDGYSEDIKGLYGEIHHEAAASQRADREMSIRLGKFSDEVKKGIFKEILERSKKVISLAEERECMIEELKQNGKDFKEAQNHYVGFGGSVVIVACVTLALGLIFAQFADLLRSILDLRLERYFLPLLWCGFVLAGAVVAAIVVWCCHCWRGKIGKDEIIRQSADIDKKMLDRDKECQEIVSIGLQNCDRFELNSIRSRTWALVARLNKIMQREFQVKVDTVDGNEEINPYSNLSAQDEEWRRGFCNKMKMIEETTLRNKEAIKDSMKERGVKDFQKLWGDLCEKDAENAGYFPAKYFIREIREFTLKFLIDTLAKIQSESLSEEKIKEAVEDWFKSNGDWSDFPMSSATGESNICGDRRRLIFAQKELTDLANSMLEQTQNEHDITIDSPKERISDFRQLIVCYEEKDVTLTVDSENSADEKAAGQVVLKNYTDEKGGHR